MMMEQVGRDFHLEIRNILICSAGDVWRVDPRPGQTC